MNKEQQKALKEKFYRMKSLQETINSAEQFIDFARRNKSDLSGRKMRMSVDFNNGITRKSTYTSDLPADLFLNQFVPAFKKLKESAMKELRDMQF